MTSGELAIERATGSTASGRPRTTMRPTRRCALAVGEDQHPELAHQRVERLAEPQLVLRLGLDAHAGRAAREREHGVARGELAVHADAVERALHAYAGEQVERLRRQRGVGLHEAEHRGEAGRDHPGALGLAGEAHRRRRRAPPRGRPAWGRCRSSGSPRRRSRRRRPARRSAARTPPSTGSRGSSTPITPVEATPTCAGSSPSPSAAAACIASAVSRPRWPSPTFEQPELAATARRPPRSARRETITGAPTRALLVKRAADTVSAASETSTPDVEALGLDAARHAGGAEAGRQRGRLRPRGVCRSAPPSASGRSRSLEPLRLRQAEHQVQVLDRLAGGALPEVVDRAER